MNAWKWWFFFQKDFWVGARCLALCLWQNHLYSFPLLFKHSEWNCSFLVWWRKDSGSWELLALCGPHGHGFCMKDGVWVGQGVSCSKAAVEARDEDVLAGATLCHPRVPHNLIHAPPPKVTYRVSNLLWAANICSLPSPGPPAISQK